LRENYFIKLMRYVKNVYQMDRQIEQITDSRLKPSYKTSKKNSMILVGFLLRTRSFNQLNYIIKSGEFNNIYAKEDRVPKVERSKKVINSILCDRQELIADTRLIL